MYFHDSCYSQCINISEQNTISTGQTLCFLYFRIDVSIVSSNYIITTNASKLPLTSTHTHLPLAKYHIVPLQNEFITHDSRKLEVWAEIVECLSTNSLERVLSSVCGLFCNCPTTYSTHHLGSHVREDEEERHQYSNILSMWFEEACLKEGSQR